MTNQIKDLLVEYGDLLNESRDRRRCSRYLNEYYSGAIDILGRVIDDLEKLLEDTDGTESNQQTE